MKRIIISFVIAIPILYASCQKKTCQYDASDTFPYSCDKGMDVAFVIDYTGSMGGVIDNIKTNVASIVSNIITQSGGDYRLSLSIFDESQKLVNPGYFAQPAYALLPASQRMINSTGTGTNQYLTVMEPFSANNSASFGLQLAKLNTAGVMFLGNGVGGPEPGGMLSEKLINAAFAGAWRINKTKLLIIITDALDGGDDDTANATDDLFLQNLATSANINQIQCILITSRATGSSNYETHLIANNTAGLKLMSANFANIAPKIDSMINQLCINNK